MKIVLAPDSFKGSLSAVAVSSAVAEGIRLVDSSHDVIEHPLADGGEGTLDVLASLGFSRHSAVVHNSWGVPITASWALHGTTAVIESAQAFGFISGATSRDALRASSAGVGELILAALELSPSEIVLCVGGTSGTDGGVGMLQALGARALDVRGADISPGGGNLRHLRVLDTATLDSRLAGVRITVATDVTNPLLGEGGAAKVFAPQKGADPAGVEALEAGLAQAAEVIGAHYAALPGSGAGGGLAYGALSVLEAQYVSGATTLMAMTGFEGSLEGAGVVVTGEGSFDDQSVSGKITGSVIAAASEKGIPVVVVCGVSRLAAEGPNVSVLEISRGQPSVQASIDNARALLVGAGSEIARQLA